VGILICAAVFVLFFRPRYQPTPMEKPGEGTV
jgi:hypothetical protein